MLYHHYQLIKNTEKKCALNYYVHVTYLFLNGSIVIMQNTLEKADLLKTKVNGTKITKVHVDGNKLHTGKEWRP